MSAPSRPLELGRVGEAVQRLDAIPKATGAFAYSSDLSAAGMLHGHTLRSPHPHARIVSIDLADALSQPGVGAILTHEGVPGNKRYGLELPDQPVLAIGRVRYVGEPVAIVAAEHPDQARRAAERIDVEYEPLRPRARTRAGAASPGPLAVGTWLAPRSATERRALDRDPPRRSRDRG
jgi:CO/xanthine dehydrogenase Mo-binding subunit